MTRTVSNAEINAIQDNVNAALVKELKIELR
jgi:phenylalanyl-tRNA synthetase beta subunit